jgi:sRNA-binding protein
MREEMFKWLDCAEQLIFANSMSKSGNTTGTETNPTAPELNNATAESLWQLLDDLADNNPEQYKQFIAQQFNEAKANKEKQKKQKEKPEEAALFTPKPHFVIYTKQTEPNPEKNIILYINMCSSTEIQPILLKKDAQTAARGDEPLSEVLIPLSVGNLRPDPANSAQFISDVVYNPGVLSRAEQDLAFKLQIIELALQHIEEDYSLHLHRAYKFHTTSNYYGKVVAQQQREEEILKEQYERRKNQAKKRQNEPEIILPTKENLLKLAESKTQGKPLISELKLEKITGKNGPNSNNTKKKVLIEELEDNNSSPISAAASKSAPIYHFLENSAAKSCEISIELPEISTISQLRVDISAGQLLVESEKYWLQWNWPQKIVESEATAKFSKKTHVLRVSAPYS